MTEETPPKQQAVSQYGVIASDRRERGDLNSATAAVTRDCHVAALLAMTVFRVCMVSIHNYDTAWSLKVPPKAREVPFEEESTRYAIWFCSDRGHQKHL